MPPFLLGPATHINWFYDGLSIITVISLGFQALLLSALVWPSYSITSLVATSRNPLALFGRAPPLRVRLPGGVGFPVFPIYPSPRPGPNIASPTRELAGGISHITNRALRGPLFYPCRFYPNLPLGYQPYSWLL